jgi:hypothetical protein
MEYRAILWRSSLSSSDLFTGRDTQSCNMRQLLLTVVYFTMVQVQVQVCFTSVCGQVQPLDVALSNSV